MKTWIKYLTKGSLYAGIPAVTTGITLGVVLGYKNNVINNGVAPPKNVGERYFDQVIYKSDFELKNRIVFPPDGINLLIKENLILLDTNFSSKKAWIKLLDNDSNKDESIPPEKIFKIDFSNINQFVDIEKKLVETNKAIANFVDQNSNVRYGLYWTIFPSKRTALIELYKIKTNKNDLSIVINYYQEILKLKPRDGVKLMTKFSDFLTTMLPPHTLSADVLDKDYGLSASGQKLVYNLKRKSIMENGVEVNQDYEIIHDPQNLSSPFKDIPFNYSGFKLIKKENTDKEYKLYVDQFTDHENGSQKMLKTEYEKNIENKSNTTNSFNFLSNYSSITLDHFLLKKGFVLMHSPSVTYVDNPKNGEESHINLILIFYKLKANSIVARAGNVDHVKNPKNIYKKVIKIPIKPVFSQITYPRKNANDENNPISVNGQSIKIEDKSSKKASSNKDILFERLTKTWISYMNLPIVQPALNLIGKVSPSIFSHTYNFIESIKVMQRLLTSGNQDLIDKIFKTSYQKSDETAKKDLLTRILEGFNNSDYLQSQLLWEYLFLNFTGDANSYWSNMDAFISSGIKLGNRLSENEPSNGRLLYMFVSAMRLMGQKIKERIMMLVEQKVLKDNPYNNFEDSRLIEELLWMLKDNGVIKNKVTIYDIISDPIAFAGIVIEALWEEKSIKIEPKYLKLVLSILGKDVSTKKDGSYNNINSKIMIDILGKFLSDEKNVSIIVQLLNDSTIDWPNRGQKLIDKIMQNPYALVSVIADNINEDNEEMLQKLGNMIFDTDLLKAVIALFIGSDIDIAPIIKKLKYGFKDKDDFKNSFTNIADDVAIKLVLTELENTIFEKTSSLFKGLLKEVSDDDWQAFKNIFRKGFTNMSINEIRLSLEAINKILFSLSKGGGSPLLKALLPAETINNVADIAEKLIGSSYTDKSQNPSDSDIKLLKALIATDADAKGLNDQNIVTKSAWDDEIDKLKTSSIKAIEKWLTKFKSTNILTGKTIAWSVHDQNKSTKEGQGLAKVLYYLTR